MESPAAPDSNVSSRNPSKQSVYDNSNNNNNNFNERASSKASARRTISKTVSVQGVHEMAKTPSIASKHSRNVSMAQLMDLGALPRNPNFNLPTPEEASVSDIAMMCERFEEQSTADTEGPPTSGISFRDKLRPSLAAFGTSQTLGALTVQPYLYLTIFKGNSVLMSIIGFVMIAYDVWNGPMFGMWSDQGFFNFACFRDLKVWGRRAPLTLLSIPVGMVAFLMNFNAGWISDLDLDGWFSTGVAVACWYAVVNVLIATCFSMYFCASGSSVSELFPTQEERLTVLMFRGPTDGIGAVIGMAVLGSLAVGQTGGTTQSHLILLGIAVYTAALWLLILPWGFLQTRSVMTKPTKYPNLIWVMLDLLKAVPPFRWYIIGEHVMAGGVALFTTVVPFALRYVLEFGDDAPFGYSILVLAIGVIGVFTYPVAPFLLRRFDAAPLIGVVAIIAGLCIAAACVAGYFLRDNFHASIGAMALIAGIGGGVGTSLWNMMKTIILTFIIDYDQVMRAQKMEEEGGVDVLPPRRDGLFVTCHQSFGILAKVWIHLFILVSGFTGYDADLDDEGIDQPRAYRTYVFAVTVGVCPIMFIIYGCCMLMLPLKAEKLAHIKQEYARLYKKAKALKQKEMEDADQKERKEPPVEGGGAAAAASGGGEPQQVAEVEDAAAGREEQRRPAVAPPPGAPPVSVALPRGQVPTTQ